jgi:hypothetical protein
MSQIDQSRYPTRKASGLPQTVTWQHDPNSQGFEYAAWSRAEYARLYSNA